MCATPFRLRRHNRKTDFTARNIKRALAAGFIVQHGDASDGVDLDGRWWWTLNQPGWLEVRSSHDTFDSKSEAWAAALEVLKREPELSRSPGELKLWFSKIASTVESVIDKLTGRNSRMNRDFTLAMTQVLASRRVNVSEEPPPEGSTTVTVCAPEMMPQFAAERSYSCAMQVVRIEQAMKAWRVADQSNDRSVTKESAESTIVCMLTDLRHYCDAIELEFSRLDRLAKVNYADQVRAMLKGSAQRGE